MAGLTIDNPVTFTQALASMSVIAGDTLLLRAGTYTGNYISALVGTSERPIIIKNYPNERAIIDGSLTLDGEYTHWQGLEIKNSGYTNRVSPNTTPAGVLLRSGLGHKIINCIVYDHYQGFSGGDGCGAYEIYGCLIYHNGNDSGLGHGVYVQHSDQASNVLIENNVVFNNFAYGFHLYGNPAFYNFTLNKNTSFHNGSPRNEPHRNLLLGGYGGVYNPTVTNNHLYHQMDVGESENFRIGWGVGNTVANAHITGNYSVQANNGAYLTDCDNPTVIDNTFLGSAYQNISEVQSSLADNFPINTYGAKDSWTDTTFLEPNTYDATRAHLTVFNKSQANTVSVDVSAIYSNGDTIYTHNVQDYFADIQSLLVVNGTITINMQVANRTVATPVGWTAPASTFPQFGAFVLEKA